MVDEYWRNYKELCTFNIVDIVVRCYSTLLSWEVEFDYCCLFHALPTTRAIRRFGSMYIIAAIIYVFDHISHVTETSSVIFYTDDGACGIII